MKWFKRKTKPVEHRWNLVDPTPPPEAVDGPPPDPPPMGGPPQRLIDILLEVLDDLELSIRFGAPERALFIGFVWAQRRHYILRGKETWQDQKIPPIGDIRWRK